MKGESEIPGGSKTVTVLFHVGADLKKAKGNSSPILLIRKL